MSSLSVRLPVVLNEFLLNEFVDDKFQKEIFLVVTAIATATKAINNEVRSAAINNLFTMTNIKNVQGEEVKPLDVIGNENFKHYLSKTNEVYAMVSEEDDDVILCNKNGNFIICFDPLDGSSNIELSIPVGSIFSIYKRDNSNEKEAVLRKGSDMLLGGYALYGSSTMVVIATHHGVNGFTLNPVSGEYELTHKKITVPKRGNIYSVNEGNQSTWLETTKNYIQSRKELSKPYSLRYVGSMVADVHRTLLKGGIFLYPADKKSPNGKLRLLYECNPMSFIMEMAGGKASTGKERVLDINPRSIHERVPIFLGSAEDVDDFLTFHK